MKKRKELAHTSIHSGSQTFTKQSACDNTSRTSPQVLKKKKKSSINVYERNKIDEVQQQMEAVPLPMTGIDQPFLKRRPVFIKEAPNYEPTNKRTLAQQL